MSAARFVILTALANLALYHFPLFAFALANLDAASFNGVQTLLTLAILAWFITTLSLSLLGLLSHRLLKPFCVIAAIGNSIAVYYVATYQVVLDITMMGNVLNTNAAEAGELIHPKVFAYLALLGLLPAVLLLRARIEAGGRLALARNAAIALVLVLAWSWSAAGTSLWIDEHARRLGGMVMPWSYLINGGRHLAGEWRTPREVERLPPATVVRPGKSVVVLVIGEAARSQNFSLYGYSRHTNPLLEQAGVVALNKPVACSTYTTASLRCILSHAEPRSQFGTQYEPLPSYLHRHDVDVIWRTRNWGEPLIEVTDYQRIADLGCTGDRCRYDEAMLTGLAKRIRASTRDKVLVVLHQTGSHGPEYFSRYPAEFERFTPVCKSVELHQCTPGELVNAYDNTILYTDHFLDLTIGVLRELAGTPAVMIYVSDHGESLGEFGLYLHGTPMAIAPDVQKDIPFLLWMSAEFQQVRGIDPGTFSQAAGHSQANAFHSVMGALGLGGPAYEAGQDVFARAEKGA